MLKILFICHGNICRSPMAEFVMKDLAEKAGLSGELFIASAATSAEELGNPVYPPVQRLLAARGISCKGKTARQLTREDYGRFDLLVGMDRANLRNMRRICGGDPEGKLRLLLDFTARARWTTPGTRAASRRPGGTSARAARGSSPPSGQRFPGREKSLAFRRKAW